MNIDEIVPDIEIDTNKVSLNDIVQSAINGTILFWDDISSNINLDPECNEKKYNFYHVENKPYTLRRLLDDIIFNAKDALEEKFGEDNPNKGFINIKTYKIIKNEIMYDVVEIEDNGIGMTAETKRRFFERGYTTKKKGTGVGLNDFKSVIEYDLNGHYELESGLNRGTTFKLYFNPK